MAVNIRASRRRFLQSTAAGGAVLGLGDVPFVSGLSPAALAPVKAEDAQLDPKMVRLSPQIEPLVRLIETTPRQRLMEEIGSRVRTGLSYREVLAALLLAGVRNVQPRPSVGHKFHSVLVVNSAHIASMASPDGDRWLPIFWALDHFKDGQSRDEREGDWTMSPVEESKVPAGHEAKAAFIAAMESWDEGAADVAVAALARTAGAGEVFELFFRYGARDFRSIGHKAIYVANTFRTLQTIGWHHAEPVLRSLAFALLAREGRGNPATEDLAPDRPWRRNQELARKLPAGWRSGRVDKDATTAMLATLREGSDSDACDLVVKLIGQGVSPQSIWDALFDGAGELLLRQPGIVALHAVTTTNALYFAFQASGDDLTRRLVLLQNAAFVPLFRDAMGRRGNVSDRRVDTFEPVALSAKEITGPKAIEEIFAEVGGNEAKRVESAGKALAYLRGGGDGKAMIDAARRLVFLKGNDAHDYKFTSAVLEDYHHISPGWRDAFLATSVMRLCGAAEADNALVGRIRAALA